MLSAPSRRKPATMCPIADRIGQHEGSARSVRRARSLRGADLRGWIRRVPCVQHSTLSAHDERLARRGRLRGRGVGVPIGDVERERVALVFADAAELVADLEGRVDDFGVPLLAGAVAEDRVELFVRDAFAVRAGRSTWRRSNRPRPRSGPATAFLRLSVRPGSRRRSRLRGDGGRRACTLSSCLTPSRMRQPRSG